MDLTTRSKRLEMVPHLLTLVPGFFLRQESWNYFIQFSWGVKLWGPAGFLAVRTMGLGEGRTLIFI